MAQVTHAWWICLKHHVQLTEPHWKVIHVVPSNFFAPICFLGFSSRLCTKNYNCNSTVLLSCLWYWIYAWSRSIIEISLIDWLIDYVSWSAELFGPVEMDSCSFLNGTVCLGWCEYNNQCWMQIKTTRPRRPWRCCPLTNKLCAVRLQYKHNPSALEGNTFMFMFMRHGLEVLSEGVILHQNYKFCWSTLNEVTYPGSLTFRLCENETKQEGKSTDVSSDLEQTKWTIGMKRP